MNTGSLVITVTPVKLLAALDAMSSYSQPLIHQARHPYLSHVLVTPTSSPFTTLHHYYI